MKRLAVLSSFLLSALFVAAAWAGVALNASAATENEYAKHFSALSKLSVAVAEAMPASDYGFRPHPESMTFGELISHIATTNYAFCAGLKDANVPQTPSPADKDAIVKFLNGSFRILHRRDRQHDRRATRQSA